MASEVFVLLKNGVLHCGVRLHTGAVLSDERCNWDDSSGIKAVYEMDDEAVAASLTALKHCERCFAETVETGSNQAVVDEPLEAEGIVDEDDHSADSNH